MSSKQKLQGPFVCVYRKAIKLYFKSQTHSGKTTKQIVFKKIKIKHKPEKLSSKNAAAKEAELLHATKDRLCMVFNNHLNTAQYTERDHWQHMDRQFNQENFSCQKA